jgi:phosphoribosylamine--glycine ligase
MKNILLVGSGAREHAIATAIIKSPQDVNLYVVGNSHNPGIKELAEGYVVGDICDPKFVTEYALENKINFAVLGPEAVIAAGIGDSLEEAGIKSASPNKTTGQLESSKSFTRNLLNKYNIAGNPKFQSFTSEEGLADYLKQFGDDFVVKDDGLKGGKGVKVSGDHLNGFEEGLAYALECLRGSGKVIIEEKMVGQEFSLMSFCDGKTTVDMPAIQDHKRAFVGDKGPNTGGMGTYSDADHSLPFLTADDIKQASEITKKVAAAMKEETGQEFKGVMYGGFMAVKDGVRLIEYNARFGDPEAMNIFTLLNSDFVAICEAIIEGTLDQAEVNFDQKATVCKYLVPEGYPTNSVKGEKIELPSELEDVDVYFASVDKKEDGLYLKGSRAVAFVASGETLGEAEQKVEKVISMAKGPVRYRPDIGTAEVLDAKITQMKEIRG